VATGIVLPFLSHFLQSLVLAFRRIFTARAVAFCSANMFQLIIRTIPRRHYVLCYLWCAMLPGVCHATRSGTMLHSLCHAIHAMPCYTCEIPTL
jgi:hypothetical protein